MEQRQNRLAREQSPYLRQHADNPVDWYPWGEEAFARARADNKPIFLSIGYSTCHWCHVMARESFEDPLTAMAMNELFINIKLDREERPDIDRVYMTYVQATTGSGGWPMSVWLQPDLVPIFGGTYFPPADRYGRKGFVSVCRSVARAWREDAAKVKAHGERVMAGLREHARVFSQSATPAPIAGTLREAVRVQASMYDDEWGGFGSAPKFPRPVILALLARATARLGRQDPDGARAFAMLEGTLTGMIAGGMHDQLGGGFHRYSVDRFWHVPHFEKMLYDQAQLVSACVDAFQLGGSESYAVAARMTLDYVRRDLRSPEGGFYSAEDADSAVAHDRPEHAEGAFYVWTKAEIEKVLPAEKAAAVCARCLVEAGGNAPEGSDPHDEFGGKNILCARGPGEISEAARRALLAARDQRPRPHRDDKIITAWNGLMISACARSFQTWRRRADLDLAIAAVNFIRDNLVRKTDGALLRSFREGPGGAEAFAEDYAFLIAGLLDLYEASFDAEHLRWAEQLQERQDALFRDVRDGGYFSARADDSSVLLRLKDDHDGAEPSASSIATLNLARLAALTGRSELLTLAQQTAGVFGGPSLSQTMPAMLAAQDFLAEPPMHVTICGRRDDPNVEAFLHIVRQGYRPNKVVDFKEAAAPSAQICRDQTCNAPVSDPEEFRRQYGA